MGKTSRPPRVMGQSDEAYFQTGGQAVQLELRLRFVPRLSENDYVRIKAAHVAAESELAKPASGKMEYIQRQQALENHPAPRFYTPKASIYLEYGNAGTNACSIEPQFVEFYPSSATNEIHLIISQLNRVFAAY